GWATSSTATTWTFSSGGTYTPTANQTLYGVCTVNSYNVTVNFAGAGVSSVTFTATGQTSRTVTASGGTASLVYNVPYTMTMAFTSGYEFESWALNSTSYGTLSSTSANPATFTIKASNDGVITATGRRSCSSSLSGYMQDFELCGSISDTYGTLTDKRDGQMYAVVVIDGALWMNKNLAIGCNGNGNTYGSGYSSKTLTSLDSNVSSSYTTATSAPSYGASGGRLACSSTYGAWYNFEAASAGTNAATYDICPKGWRLPTKDEVTKVISYASRLNIVAGGRYGDFNDYPGQAWWWTTTAAGSGRKYLLRNTGSGLTTDDYVDTVGYYARCIYKNAVSVKSISDISNMQDVSPAVVDATSNNTATSLADSRDSQKYNIAKINGNLWMTRNLAIGCNGSANTYGSGYSSKTLNSSNSNVSDSYTTPTVVQSSYVAGSMLCSSSYGAWYNFLTATAGTINSQGTNNNDSNTNTPVYDICPKGWRLPTLSEVQTLTSYATVFNPSVGGRVEYSSPNYTSNGWWWTVNTYSGDSSRRWLLRYTGSGLTTDDYVMSTNHYIRCVAKK
ncbi:hypothetical protein J6S55_01690, partial [Candidatus Saccharibacteria bacterium]|nr:hypothetical protein [Candidatus Saccharibacteria bacterium]